MYVYIHIYTHIYGFRAARPTEHPRRHRVVDLQGASLPVGFGTGSTGTQPNGYLVFFLQAVLGCVQFVKFLEVCFPVGLGTH